VRVCSIVQREEKRERKDLRYIQKSYALCALSDTLPSTQLMVSLEGLCNGIRIRLLSSPQALAFGKHLAVPV